MAQGADERLSAPMPERCVINQALPARGPAGSLDHVGLDRGFVDEGQSFQMPGHEGLAFADPDAAQVGHVLALLLKRLKIFFCVTARALATADQWTSDALPSRDPRQVRLSVRQLSDQAAP